MTDIGTYYWNLCARHAICRRGRAEIRKEGLERGRGDDF
jgi:hypothetical protein